MKPITIPCTLTALLLIAPSLTTGFGGKAKVIEGRELNATPTNKPVVVYVTDFELHAADIKSEPGLVPPPPKLPGPLGGILPPLSGAPKDPDKLARELVDGMSEALIKDLTKPASRRSGWRTPTTRPPTAGSCAACS